MLQEKRTKVLILVLVSLMSTVFVSEVVAQALQAGPNQGFAAIDRAAKANKYLFIFFFRQDDPQTRAMREVFNNFINASAGRANSVAVSVADPSEAEMVAKFRVSQAPMPLVLVLAPNGAVTAGLPGNFTKEQLVGAFATPCTESLLGAIQQGKLVMLCLQNGRTRLNAEAMNGVRALKADQQYSAAIEVVMLDPNSAAERSLLAKLGMNDPVEEATTLLLAPPGSVIGTLKGATDKDQLVKTIATAIASCAAGCQPGGQCCPPAK
jgi:hypothetical protein